LEEITGTLEANTRNPTSVEGGVLGERPRERGLRGLLGSKRAKDERGSRVPGRRASDPATRLEHYLGNGRATVLHHRRLPGVAGEVSHLIIGPAGITVVDSGGYSGRRVRLNGGVVRIGLRNRSDLIDSLVDRVRVVRELLAGTPYAEVPVEAALARRKVEGGPIVPNDETRFIVCGTRRIAGEASRPGPLSTQRVNALAAYLDAQLGSK